MACYEDGGAIPLRDVGRLANQPDGMDDLSMACYDDGGAMPLM